MAMAVCEAIAAQIETDRIVLAQLAEKYEDETNVAQGEVNRTRERHGENFVLSAIGFSSDLDWDTDIEASSFGDVSMSSSTVDLTSEE